MKLNQALSSLVVVLMSQAGITGAFMPAQQPRVLAVGNTYLAATSSASSSSSSSGSTEVERLLAKAAALRAEAAKAEHQVHSKEAEKKKQHDAETDARIDYLFSGGKKTKNVVQNLKNKRY